MLPDITQRYPEGMNRFGATECCYEYSDEHYDKHFDEYSDEYSEIDSEKIKKLEERRKKEEEEREEYLNKCLAKNGIVTESDYICTFFS